MSEQPPPDPFVQVLHTEMGIQFAFDAARAGDAIGIAWKDNQVVLVLGGQQWALSPATARRVAEAMQRAADQADASANAPTQSAAPEPGA